MMISTNEEESILAFHCALLEKIGSVEHFLSRVDNTSLKNMRHYNYHIWEGVGEFTCESEGIIEPVVQSIQNVF